MSKYICSVCGFVYDEALGSVDYNISPNTKWEDLPEDWVCPWCAAPKSDFNREESEEKVIEEVSVKKVEFEGDMNALEMSALFSNLARGFEKSYKPEEQELCLQISEYYRSKNNRIDGNVNDLISLVKEDLDNGLTSASAISSEHKDRGALRALVWSEKVTKILSSILNRFEKEKDDLIENNDIYVCSICGFVYIGNDLPELCPVCKVPNWKFEKIGAK